MVVFGPTIEATGEYVIPILIAAGLILGMIIGWLIVVGSRKTAPQNPTKEKTTTYACGEDLDVGETRPDSEMFFSPIREFFRGFYDTIRPSHSGDLNAYLSWVVWGMVMILVLVWIVLRVV